MAQDESDGDQDARLIAHDLLQSVSIVQSVLGAVRAGDLPGRVSQDLDVVGTEVQVMATRLKRILAGPEALLSFDVGELVERVLERIAPTYSGQIDTDIEAFHLVGDRFDWERSLLNLVENACRAAGPHGKVVISCRRLTEVGRVEVADDGPGFGEGRVGRSSIGLAAVTRLVDGHGGHLELRRSHLGGAQLSIVVPLADSADTSAG